MPDSNELIEQSSLRKQLSEEMGENGLNLQPEQESNQPQFLNSARKNFIQQSRAKVPLANSDVLTASLLGVAVLQKDVFREWSPVGFRMEQLARNIYK